MKRINKETEIGQSLEIDTDYCSAKPFSIKEMYDYLIGAEKTGATHINITGNSDDGYLYDVNIQPIKIEIENDKDYTKRKIEEESRILAAENKEKVLYHELKLKYGD